MPKIGQKGFAHILFLIVLMVGLSVGVYLVGQKTNLLPKAASLKDQPPMKNEWITGVKADTYCNKGFQCDSSNVLESDGTNAGLVYKNEGGTICKLDGVNLTSCVNVDLGGDYTIAKAKVTYKMVDSICGEGCAGQYCGTDPGGFVFYSTDKSNWKKIDKLDYSTELITKEFEASASARYLQVCRGGGGAARDNIAVDNISALVLTAVTQDPDPDPSPSVSPEVSVSPTAVPAVTPTPSSTPAGEKERALSACDKLKDPAKPYCLQFAEKDYAFNKGMGYANSSLESYPWSESYILMAYARMYRATGSTVYLDKLIKHIDIILANRDDKKGRKDYKGISGAGWAIGGNYTQEGKPMRFLVHSGMITAGMVDFIKIVSDDSKLNPAYKEKADQYLTAVKEVVAAHDKEWNDGASQYYALKDAPVDYSGSAVPLNMEAIMGRNLLYLYDLTGDKNYINKATKMAWFFKKNLSLSGTAYVWKYWPGVGDTTEDISHANLDIWFALTAYEHNVVFNKTDMERFAQTFLKNVYRGTGANIYKNVNRSDSSSDPSWLLAPGRAWIDLNTFSDNKILPVVKNYYNDAVLKNVSFGSASSGLAALTDLLNR